MAEFINTADVIGDEEMCDQIIQRTVIEYKENRVTKLGQYAFYKCTNLTKVDLPNATAIGNHAFDGCHRILRFTAPKLATMPNYTNFFPQNWTTTGHNDRAIYDFASLTSIGNQSCSNVHFMAFILRSPTVCTIDSQTFHGSNSSTNWFNTGGRIYVPRALLDSYKSATNWSNYASSILPLEDYTVDGTSTGKFKGGNVTHNVYGVTREDPDRYVMGSYTTNVVPFPDSELVEVSVVMDGVDITNSVYSNGTINIPEVTGDVVVTAKSNLTCAIMSIPLYGAISGDLPCYKMDVTAGQKLRLHYYLTKNSGMLYDGRGCGTGYKSGGYTLNAHTTQDVTIVSTGYIVFGDHYLQGTADGEIGANANYRLSGKYFYVEILE